MKNNPLAFIIEDDDSHAKFFSDAVAQAGYEIEIIRDGSTALVRLEQAVPDVVILDINLPFVSGTEILRHIRGDKRFANTRVIIASADVRIADTLHNDADLILVKPISYLQLRDLSVRLGVDRT